MSELLRLRDYELSHRCDRCGHTMKEHATPLLGMMCMVGRREMRRKGELRGNPRFCPCDGFVPAP